MIPRFAHVRPRSLAEAFDALATAGGEAAWIAGGTELLQVMRMGFGQFDTLIDLKGIPDVHGIALDHADGLVIGAASTHRDIERSPLVAEHAPGLARLASRIANVRVRNAGTIGGNLAFAEPHSDPATFLLACGATVQLVGPGGERALGIGEFVLGPLSTAREPGEILRSVLIPAAVPGEGRAYEKIAFFERPAASVGVAVRVADGAVAGATVTVGSLTETPVVVADAGTALVGAEARPEALDGPLAKGRDALGRLDVVADLNGSPDYKRHLAGVLLGRAAQAALVEAIAHA